MRFKKEKVDGFCECALCGKKIEGLQNWDSKFEEFVCDGCLKNQQNIFKEPEKVSFFCKVCSTNTYCIDIMFTVSKIMSCYGSSFLVG